MDELRGAKAARAHVVRFDDLLAGAEVEPADEVLVRPSMWRGHSFIALCEWIVCAKLASPGSHVVWHVPSHHRLFEGSAPDAAEMPAARSFVATLGSRELSFEADWGVFSLGHVDDGTRALFDAAHARRAATVADIGTGYGAVAVGLAAAGNCDRVVASDVDLVSLHLARRNAAANGVTVELLGEDDPSVLPPTELTTCEIPTHVPPVQTQRLVDGLVSRSRSGAVLVAVHNSLVERYVRLFADAGAESRIEDGPTHAVLCLGG